MMDKESGRHRGFGFVNYESLDSVEKVLSNGPHIMDGQVVSTSSLARRNISRPDSYFLAYLQLEVKRAQAKGEARRPDYGTSGSQKNQAYQPAPAPPAAAAPPAFDPATMAKFFQQMGWGAWNPMMMGGGGMMPGMGGMPPGMGMGGMPGAPGMGMGMGGMPPGMGMGGMGGMGFPGMGMGAMGGMGFPGMGMSGGDPSAGMYAQDGGYGGEQAAPLVSPWTGPMAAGPMRGGRGGGGGGRGRGGMFNAPVSTRSSRSFGPFFH